VAQQPAPQKASVGVIVGLTVSLLAAAAGVAYFVLGNA